MNGGGGLHQAIRVLRRPVNTTAVSYQFRLANVVMG